MSIPMKWAVKQHMKLIPEIREHETGSGASADCSEFCGFLIEYTTHESVFLVGELTGRSCQVIRLDGCVSGNNIQMWNVPEDLGFCSAVDALSNVHQDVKSAGKSGIPLFLVSLHRVDHESEQQTAPEPYRLQFTISKRTLVTKMRQRKEYKPRETKTTSSVPGPGGNDDHEDDHVSEKSEGDEDDHGSDDSLDSQDLHDSLLQELRGDICDGDDDQVLDESEETDEQTRDMRELDSIHSSFVASVSERQHEIGIVGDGDEPDAFQVPSIEN